MRENFNIRFFIYFALYPTQFLPPDGITVIGNGFHTHIYGMSNILQCYFTYFNKCAAQYVILSPYTGRGMRVQHFRQNEECGVTEELPPVDENLRFDTNFQVFLKITLCMLSTA